MKLFYHLDGDTLWLTGNTFPIKDGLKTIGARWDAVRKCWKLKNHPEGVEKLIALGFAVEVKLHFDDGHGMPATPKPKISEVAVNEKTWTVIEFLNHASNVVKTYLGGEFWLVGEVTSSKISGGHRFFELSEPDEQLTLGAHSKTAAISCVIWAGKLKALEAKYGALPLQDGLKIRIFVHCEFRKEQARINVIVDEIDLQFTAGALALNREKIVAELRKRALYDKNRRLRMPPLPLRIGLITAETSRAASDFLDELKLCGWAFSVVLCDATMQGEHTSNQVCQALKMLNSGSWGDIDCIVLTRGGGSRLDLRWFDDLEIAKQIAYSPVPVISAIGHFEDISIADEVAWRAEKTPTGAARLLGSLISDALEAVFTQAELMGRALRKRLDRERQSLTRAEELVKTTVSRRLTAEKNKILGCEQTVRLLKLTVQQTMNRGYALIKSADGHTLRAANFLPDTGRPESLLVELIDSTTQTLVIIRARVLEIETSSLLGGKK